MEVLRKLEEVQRMLTFMESRGFVRCDNHDSDRFLANLMLLLIRPCGDLDLNRKCTLIAETIPKISLSFLEEAHLFFNAQVPLQARNEVTGFRQSCVGGDGNESLPIGGGGSCVFSQGNFVDTALVGLDAVRRANSTLEDFCRSYFMFHGMDEKSPEAIFKYLPVLVFTESYIYQMDRLNEEIVNMSNNGASAIETADMLDTNGCWTSKVIGMFKSDPFRPLTIQLENLGLMTQRIREELWHGEEYWALERKLCSALRNKEEISVEDVMKAIHLKSFDYRVLNLLLYKLRGEKVNDLHMEFLSISEFLVEVSDDLITGFTSGQLTQCFRFDYEDDVIENNFNTLRMFVRIYGPSAAPSMLAACISDAEKKYDNLLKALDPQLSCNYERRCAEATKEGGKVSGHTLGTWNIPPLILDEESYRSNISSSK
ncbi:hypothetical protein K2173_014583 [Erythroxylum novogranatense]|uniref:Uncharacterized protein n=1 Tax=Erythroxylum novogranatense TaxID=1862640 RepID=A0AAV8TEZ0_9ROSI|nr:hypothetical protein K2173_014583 [Erythroxylum novogranatense]